MFGKKLFERTVCLRCITNIHRLPFSKMYLFMLYDNDDLSTNITMIDITVSFIVKPLERKPQEAILGLGYFMRNKATTI